MLDETHDALRFYTDLPTEHAIARLADDAAYARLPDGWIVGTTDLVDSTGEIARGRYKIVNTAAASVIAALSNALKGREFPFVFAGDGASFALPGALAPLAARVLGSLVRFVAESFEMRLRAALVPVETIRAAGHEVRVARYGPSPDVAYAMFTGGGLAFAEARMKAGEFALPPGEAGERPDLSGLTCRFDEIPATRGVVLSVIVLPIGPADAAFAALAQEILALADENPAGGNPLPKGGPPSPWRNASSEIERRLRSAARPNSVLDGRVATTARTFASTAMLRSGRRFGRFDAARYRRELVANSDFRKFDDGLRMTIDCTPALADRIEARLARAEADGIARSGTFRQGASLMTCFVPSPTRSDHVHFLDGAGGGYARAAGVLKARDAGRSGAADRSDAAL